MTTDIHGVISMESVSREKERGHVRWKVDDSSFIERVMESCITMNREPLVVIDKVTV